MAKDTTRRNEGKSAENQENNDEHAEVGRKIWEATGPPNNDLDFLMWGAAGLPPLDDIDDDSVRDVIDAKSENVAEATIVSNYQTPNRKRTSSENPQELFGDVRLSAIVWKRRSGLGKLSVTHSWARRRIVLAGTTMLYYKSPEKDTFEDAMQSPDAKRGVARGSNRTAATAAAHQVSENGEQSLMKKMESDQEMNIQSVDEDKKKLQPEGMTNLEPELQADDTQKPSLASKQLSWASMRNESDSKTPRGVLDLRKPNTTVEAAEEHSGGLPTPFPIRIMVEGETKWKLCFDSHKLQMEWLAALIDILGDASVESHESKEHGFEPGDHIIRWEMMMAVMYPIQIHGIVLEAGSNCVIIADFGLTGAGTTSDDDNKEKHESIIAAMKKLRPSQKQRLNVVALTEMSEIRKWKKVNYGRTFSSKKGKWGWFRQPNKKSEKENSDKGVAGEEIEGVKQRLKALESEANVTNEQPPDTLIPGPKMSNSCDSSAPKTLSGIDCAKGPADGSSLHMNEPDWFGSNSDALSSMQKSRPAVFSLDDISQDYKGSRQKQQTLPKTDPTKIVLARAHYLLEYGEEVLPPYHVFHSNSECIAVWCKTGRWSTLQTSVFLTTTMVGNAKGATVFTMGVAAAHVFLAPVAAVGGIAWVSAPWIILKKSRIKWDEATMNLTDKFWAWAEPEIFIEAIEHWGGLH